MRLTHIEATSIRNKTTITLERNEESGVQPVTLTLHALPPTYAEDAENEIPSPKAPRLGVSRDKKGRIDRDSQGRPVMLYDEQDEDYLKELRDVQQLQAVKLVVDALDRSEVQFETQKDDRPPREYYVAIRRELVDFGVSLGDYVTLVKAVSRVSGLDEDDVKVARLDFFGKENSPSDSSSTESAAS